MINVGLNSISNIKIGTTQANKVYVGSTLVWEYNSGGGLPSGYRELEYIASTASGGQYIDLDILLYDVLNKNYDIAIKFNPTGKGKDNTTQGTIFGCQDNTGSPWPGTFIRVSSTNMVGRYIGGSGKDNVLGQLGNDIELTEKTPPSKNVYNYNNGGLTHTWGTSLFCAFNSQDKTSQIRFIEAKLYYFKLFVEGTLVRDMIPCVNPNNVVGLYDLVNNVFYSSPNGAEFVAGPYVNQNFFCQLELTDGTIVDLEGSGELTKEMVATPYASTLYKMHVGNLCTSIGYQAAAQCLQLVELVIDEGVTTLDSGAFNGDSKLEVIDLPSTLTSIGNYCFHNMGTSTCNITLRGLTPPTVTIWANNRFEAANTNIYVPAEALETYKNTWTNIADKIYSIPS